MLPIQRTCRNPSILALQALDFLAPGGQHTIACAIPLARAAAFVPLTHAEISP
jgi:hypothetical protein